MAEKKKNWDEWIGASTGALGASAIKKIQKDARNEARAMSYPKREVTYSRTPQEKEARIERMMSSPTFGKVERPAKSGSVGRPSAEKARDDRRQYEDYKKKSKK
jgi:hypothetical protein